jgi:hypothetical protein
LPSGRGRLVALQGACPRKENEVVYFENSPARVKETEELQHTDTARSEQHAVQTAFNRHAKTYDERFSNSTLGESLRSNVWDIADEAFASCLELLDLGDWTSVSGRDGRSWLLKIARNTLVYLRPRINTG